MTGFAQVQVLPFVGVTVLVLLLLFLKYRLMRIIDCVPIFSDQVTIPNRPSVHIRRSIMVQIYWATKPDVSSPCRICMQREVPTQRSFPPAHTDCALFATCGTLVYLDHLLCKLLFPTCVLSSFI
jgi:hypothetical protein